MDEGGRGGGDNSGTNVLTFKREREERIVSVAAKHGGNRSGSAHHHLLRPAALRLDCGHRISGLAWEQP